MKGLVIYHTNYGSTQEYAEYIAKETGMPCVSDKVPIQEQLKEAELIVMGSNVRLIKLGIGSFAKKNAENLKGKKLMLFTVAGAPKGHPTLDQSVKASIPKELITEVQVFQFPGRKIHKKLSLIDKISMGIGKRVTKDPLALKIIVEDYDLVDVSEAKPLVDSLRSLMCIDT